MSIHGEHILEFVAASEDKAAIQGTGLSDLEKSDVSDSISCGRAQWVVDNIAAELARRAAALEIQKQELLAQLTTVNKDLQIIAAVFGEKNVNESNVQDKNQSSLIDRYYLEAHGPEARKFVHDVDPFQVELMVESYTTNISDADYKLRPSLKKWVVSNSRELEAVYGQGIVRTMMKCTDKIDSKIQWGVFREIDYQTSTEFSVVASKPTLIIKIPELFYKQILGTTTGFGYKSFVALMCIAEFQASSSDEAPNTETEQ